MAVNPVFKIKKGFIIAFDENSGRYVPFFVNVRSNEILWKDQAGFSSTIKGLVNSAEVKEKIEPNTTYRFDSNLWKILTLSNNMYQGTMIIPFTNTFFQLRSINEGNLTGENDPNFGTELVAKITFPTAFVSESDFSLRFTINTKNDVLGRCNVCFSPYQNSDGLYEGCYIRVLSNVYRFPETFYYNDEYINSKLHIELRGYNTDYVEEEEEENNG